MPNSLHSLGRVVVIAAVALVIPALDAGAQSEPHWTYSGHAGPAEWGSLSPAFASCAAGKQQSPIEIAATAPTSSTGISFSYSPSGLHVINNGHTVQANYDPGSSIEIRGAKYDLLQLHFHAPSEHTIDGKHAAIEMHLVHRNADQGLAVVGVLIREGTADSDYDAVLRNLPRSAGDSVSQPAINVDAIRLLPAGRSYWSYTGSLTTPPCSEGVSWLVMKAPVELSRAQIEALTAVVHGNARPVQPLGARAIGDKQE